MCYSYGFFFPSYLHCTGFKCWQKILTTTQRYVKLYPNTAWKTFPNPVLLLL